MLWWKLLLCCDAWLVGTITCAVLVGIGVPVTRAVMGVALGVTEVLQ